MTKSSNKEIIDNKCDHYSTQDYARFVALEMPEQDRVLFMSHAESCSSCLQGIRKATAYWQHQKEMSENAVLHASALSIMDRLDKSLFSIVISAVKGAVELIRSSGEQIAMTPAMAGVRSTVAGSQTDALVPLRLIKDIADARFSVEVTISPVEPEMLDLVVSLLDRQQEEFVPDATVACHGDNLELSCTTDVNGQAFFRVPASGFYEIAMSKGEKLLGTMTLNAM